MDPSYHLSTATSWNDCCTINGINNRSKVPKTPADKPHSQISCTLSLVSQIYMTVQLFIH